MIDKLLDIPLSEEAKALIAKSYYSNESLGISTFVEFNYENEFKKEIFKKIVNLGWGEGLSDYIKFIDKTDVSESESLRLGQLEIKKGNALVSVSKVKNGCYISINHSLADEHTLNIIKPLVKLAYEKGIDAISDELIEGRGLYHKYIERQEKLKKEKSFIREIYIDNISPVKFSKFSRLAWSLNSDRICVSRVIRLNKDITKDMIMRDLVFYLVNSKEINEGTIICSSKDWRLSNEEKAIGMMTGLIDLTVNNILYEESQFSLEICSKYDDEADKVLKCCRISELFINGGIFRGIQASQVMESSFPVGIDINKMNSLDYKIELEGKFKSKENVEILLSELSEFLVNK